MKTNFNKKIVLLLLILTMTITLLFSCTMQGTSEGTQQDSFNIEYQVLKNNEWVTISGSIIHNNAKIDLLELKDTQGNYFYGWYLDKNFTKEIKEDYLLEQKIDKNLIVYARFVKNIQQSYTVSFQLNGGVGEQTAMYKFRESINIANPTRQGYDFNGWYVDETLTIKWKDIDVVRENITLYAGWEKSQKYISFNQLINDEWKEVDQIYTSGKTILELPALDNVGEQVFDGWYFDKEYTRKFTETSLQNRIVSTKIDVYAKFITLEQNSFEVVYQTNGGDLIATEYLPYRSLITKIPTKGAVQFKGWYLDEDLTMPWNISTDRVTKNITLYAKWEEVAYQIKYNLNDGVCNTALQVNYSESNPIVLPDKTAFSKVGYDFDNFYLDGEIFDASITYQRNLVIEIRWTPKVFDVTYDDSDDQIVYDLNSPSSFNLEDGLTISAPNKTGHEFKGWYYSNEFIDDNKVDFNNLPAQNIHLYPYFEELSFTITYSNMDNATNNSLNPQSYNYFDVTIELKTTDITKIGYTFDGWYLDAAFSEPFIGENPRENLNVYAKWTIINYSLTIVLNGGTYNGEIPTTYNVETSIVLNAPQQMEYEFAGWYLDEAFNTRLNLSNTYTGDLTLYAKWVESELLDPTNYVEIPYGLEQINVYKNTSKNICLAFDATDLISNTTISNPNALISSKDGQNRLIIDKNFFNNYSVGEKINIDITFESGLVKRIYFTRTNNNPYKLEAYDYDLSSTHEYLFRIIDSSVPGSLLNVTIDGEVVPFSYNAGDITIEKRFISMHGVGSHLIKVYTDDAISSTTINVTNNQPHVPYNVKIDLDSSFPNVYVTWDYDLTPDYIKVSFTGVQEYYSNNPMHQQYFVSNNKFDATTMLKIKDTSCIVTAHKDGVDYASEQVLMPFSFYQSADSTTFINGVEEIFAYPGETGTYGYMFHGIQNNFYITSMEEYYDLITFMIQCTDSPIMQQFVYDGTTYNTLKVVLDIDLEARTAYPVTYTGIPDLTNYEYVKAMTRTMYHWVGEIASVSHGVAKIDSNTLNSNTMYKILLKTLTHNKPGEYNTISNGYLYTEVTALNHYGAGLEVHEKLPIDNVEKTAYCQDSIELYLALENGYRPVFDEHNATLAALYQKVVTALRGIVDYNMNEYQIAIVIYEYIKNNVRYDKYVVSPEQPTTEQLHSYPCFFLEGVFDNKVAVCNGIAIAYSMMLNMMGIKAEKITGATADEGHAWVKFYIAGEWYLADPTWGDPGITIGGNKYEIINYCNLFITYEHSYTQGRIVTDPCDNNFVYEGDVYIDVFANMYFTYNGQKYDHIIDSVVEYKALLEYLESLCEVGEMICTQVKATDIATLQLLNNINRSEKGSVINKAMKENTLMISLTRAA